MGVSRNTIRPIEAGQCSPTAGPALILCITPGKKFGDLAYFWHKTQKGCCDRSILLLSSPLKKLTHSAKQS